MLPARFTPIDGRKYYVFLVNPMGAVRMTQSDRWKTNPNHQDPKKRQRDSVRRYFKYKSDLQLQAKNMKYAMGDTLEAVFFLPMPKSWSAKKKLSMEGQPCKVKPDLDNITKGIKDALLLNDSNVWFEKVEKRWSYEGCILIYQ